MQWRPGLLLIETHFGIPFKEIIETLHLKKKRSIKSLSDECGISRDTFQRHAKRLGLNLRKRKEATGLTVNRGDKHWTYKDKNKARELYRQLSVRMKLNNPSHNKEVLENNMASFSKFLKKNPSPQEVVLLKLLTDAESDFVFQYPIERYVIDFFFPKHNICLEVDSSGKWGKEKRVRAHAKNAFLIQRGYFTISIEKNFCLDNKDLLIDVLDTYNLI